MTETASSIFEQSSALVIRASDQKTFLPWANGNRDAGFWGIGVFLGLVIRTGLCQDLPFSNLLWRFLAGERLGLNDIVAVDPPFSEFVKNIQEGISTTNWIVQTWDGKHIVFLGHRYIPVICEEVHLYITECVEYRIGSLKPCLKLIRKGFRENVGFKHHFLMTGAALSRLVQGNPSISIDHLKSITKVAPLHFPEEMDNEYVKRFWRVVAKLSPEQRKLLLKFIITLTRLPSLTIFPEFKIRIDAWQGRNPDESLTTASTCFNQLHLPKYTNDDVVLTKIQYAIQNCQTMENQ
jgi:hypothetical protein